MEEKQKTNNNYSCIGNSCYRTINRSNNSILFSAPNVQDGTSSTIKTYLENWYSTNFSEYDNLIANTRYCNDTTSVSKPINSPESGDNYGAYQRLRNNNPQPIFSCPNTTKTYGGEYDLKIGLLTADEIVFAGGSIYSSNETFYLKYETAYWLSSPYDSVNMDVSPNVFLFNDSNRLYYNRSKTSLSVIPVINLKSDILYTSGDGTKSSPYVVQAN